MEYIETGLNLNITLNQQHLSACKLFTIRFRRSLLKFSLTGQYGRCDLITDRAIIILLCLVGADG